MWLTDIHLFDQIAIYYKRSLDNGATWQPKQLLWTGGCNTSYEVKRMVVSGNDVHILVAYNDVGSTRYDELLYLRSRDGGSTFEAPRTIHTAAQYWGIGRTFISADGDHVTVCFDGGYWDGRYFIGRLLVSEDGGDTFNLYSVYDIGETSDDFLRIGDMQRSGNNVVVVYLQGNHYSGSQWHYRKLYAASSTDGGATFHKREISRAQPGWQPSGTSASRAELCTQNRYRWQPCFDHLDRFGWRKCSKCIFKTFR